MYLTSINGSLVIVTNLSLLSFSMYEMHSKCLYGGAVLVIVTSAAYNASDMLRDTPCMEIASTSLRPGSYGRGDVNSKITRRPNEL